MLTEHPSCVKVCFESHQVGTLIIRKLGLDWTQGVQYCVQALIHQAKPPLKSELTLELPSLLRKTIASSAAENFKTGWTFTSQMKFRILTHLTTSVSWFYSNTSHFLTAFLFSRTVLIHSYLSPFPKMPNRVLSNVL